MTMPITRGKIETPQHAVVYGPEGIGKTELASKFPNPVFCDTEGSTSHIDVARTPVPNSWAMFLQIVNSLAKDTQGYQTFVVDTADWLERLCSEHICAKHGVDSIEGIGYGKGYVYMAEEFGRVLDSFKALNMHVVLTAHAKMRKFELPEETGSYDRWELKLSKNVAPLVKEWADMILFANYQIYVVTPDDKQKDKKKAQGGTRVMYTSHHPCWDAKNRHGLPEKIKLDFAEIAHCFPAIGRSVAPAAPAAPSQAPAPAPSSATPLTQLLTLLEHDNIDPESLMGLLAARGSFPTGTPVESLPDDYISNKLLPNWTAVLGKLQQEPAHV